MRNLKRTALVMVLLAILLLTFCIVKAKNKDEMYLNANYFSPANFAQ